mmetsp:Transcript_25571/g.46560  ORF Transcript_25571/g.46560 Transcript_25571/m.46560 type:complete len:161 (+) Transcript_25571:881-1363(+)
MAAQDALKRTGADAVGNGSGNGEEAGGGTGIILKRQARPTAGAAGGGAGSRVNDPAVLREMVQKLASSSTPLAKSMDYLQEDLENMRKEYKFWVTEKRLYIEELQREERVQGETGSVDARMNDLESQIKQAKDRIIGLKGQVLRNDDKISKLLVMATSGK